MVEADLLAIGKRIQMRRKQCGYTQEQLAEKMNVSIQMVSNLERGNKAIRIDNLIRLSIILDISTDYILTGKETAGNLQTLTRQIALLTDRDRRILGKVVDFCLEEEGGLDSPLRKKCEKCEKYD